MTLPLAWIPDVLHAAGLAVVPYVGWQARGKGDIKVRGVVCHHTATGPNVSNTAVARLLAEGRSDLKGPLAQLGLDRDGHYWMIAAGQCNHNGYGTWGNDSIGIEAFNDGVGEPWPAQQIDAYERGCAALIAHLGLSIAEVRGHKETDPSRKIDPRGIDMDTFRLHVHSHLITPAPSPISGDDEMFTYEYDAAGAAPNILVLVAGGKQVRITNAGVTAQRRTVEARASHLGPVDKTEFDGFATAFGPVIGL